MVQRIDGAPREVVDKDHTREEFISSSTRHVLENPQKKKNLMDDFLIEGDDKLEPLSDDVKQIIKCHWTRTSSSVNIATNMWLLDMSIEIVDVC